MTTTTHRMADCDDLWAAAIDPRLGRRAPISGPSGESLVVEITPFPGSRLVIRPADADDAPQPYPHVRRGGAA